MRTPAIYLLTATLALLILVAVADYAPARTLSISNQTFRTTWNDLTFEGALTSRCDVTLEGSFHARTIPKVVGSLLGYVTKANVNDCTIPTQVLTLPWHIRYLGFSGRLPEITDIRINIIGYTFLFDFGVARCLYRSTETRPQGDTLNLVGGVVTSIRFDESTPMPLFRRLSTGLISCPPEGRYVGTTNRVTVLNSPEAITVTLI